MPVTSVRPAESAARYVATRYGKPPSPVVLDFDLGAVYRVNAVALWNTSGDGAIDEFTLFADTASSFGGATNLGGFSATLAAGSGGLAEFFTFGTVNARYLRVQATAAAFDFVRFNEFAASGAAVENSAVPEPSSLVIFAIGRCIMGLGYTRRRKRMVAA